MSEHIYSAFLRILAGAAILFAASLVLLVLYVVTLTNWFPPPVAECNGIYDCPRAQQDFTSILNQNFPIGTDGSVVRSVLMEQGFEFDPSEPERCFRQDDLTSFGTNTGGRIRYCPEWDQNWSPRNLLEYSWGFFPCINNASVRWSLDDSGKITNIDGDVSTTCL